MTVKEYLELIEEYETGESVRLTIIRNRTYYDVDVTFEDAKPLVIENNKVTHLTPVYSGLIDYTIPDGSWCYYSYINENKQ